jgi:hypothetical protein
VRHVVRGTVDAAQPDQLDDVGRGLEAQLGGDRRLDRDDPLGEHRGAHLCALLGHHRAPPGDAVHEALAVLVADRRPGHVGAPALLAHEVSVGHQPVDRAAQRDPADPVLLAQHRLGREQRVLGQRGHPPAQVLADREVLRSRHGAGHGSKVLRM